MNNDLKMESVEKLQAIKDEYKSSLDDLKHNRKAQINMLTMLAEENINNAVIIVQVIEEHLEKVRSGYKLPVLYLIDSIVKNVGNVYKTLFTKNIASLFCSVFDKVDPGIRERMFKLRHTWSEVFPVNKMYELDVRVNNIDPVWPLISPPPPFSFHEKPRSLIGTQAMSLSTKEIPFEGVDLHVAGLLEKISSLQSPEASMSLFSISKKRSSTEKFDHGSKKPKTDKLFGNENVDLRKLSAQLPTMSPPNVSFPSNFRTNRRWEPNTNKTSQQWYGTHHSKEWTEHRNPLSPQWEKPMGNLASTIPISKMSPHGPLKKMSQNQFNVVKSEFGHCPPTPPYGANSSPPSANGSQQKATPVRKTQPDVFSNEPALPMQGKRRPIAADQPFEFTENRLQPTPNNAWLNIHKKLSTSTQPKTPATGLTASHYSYEELVGFIQKLEASRLLPRSATENMKPMETNATQVVDFWQLETLRTKQLSLVANLYSGTQCSNCGFRFSPENTKEYSQHLDWHYRQNKNKKESLRKAHGRKWFYGVFDWMQFEEFEDLEEGEPNWFEKLQAAAKVGTDHTTKKGAVKIENSSVDARSSGDNPRCNVCYEVFEQFYNDDEEAWHLRMAIRVGDNLYHTLCYEDYNPNALSQTENIEELQLCKTETQDGISETDVLFTHLKDGKFKVDQIDTAHKVPDLSTSEVVQSESAEKLKEVAVNSTADTPHPSMVSTIDDNVQLDFAESISTKVPSGKIKINLLKPLTPQRAKLQVVSPAEQAVAVVTTEILECQSKTSPSSEKLIIKNFKPALQNVNLTDYPLVTKGNEESGFCSIM